MLSKSQLLQVARQPNEAKMRDLVQRFALGLVNREQARAERNPDKKPRPAVFRFVPPAKEFKLVLQFRKNSVERDEIIAALRRIIETLEAETVKQKAEGRRQIVAQSCFSSSRRLRAPFETMALSRGERVPVAAFSSAGAGRVRGRLTVRSKVVSGSGAFISRSGTGEGSVDGEE